MIEGTKADKVIDVLDEIPKETRDTVKEITLYMANPMHKIARNCFTEATCVIDQFHVHKLAYDALQDMRIIHRWNAINEETIAFENAKDDGERYVPEELENGDTKKQLLVRSRYFLFKSGDRWREKQKKKAGYRLITRLFIV